MARSGGVDPLQPPAGGQAPGDGVVDARSDARRRRAPARRRRPRRRRPGVVALDVAVEAVVGELADHRLGAGARRPPSDRAPARRPAGPRSAPGARGAAHRLPQQAAAKRDHGQAGARGRRRPCRPRWRRRARPGLVPRPRRSGCRCRWPGGLPIARSIRPRADSRWRRSRSDRSRRGSRSPAPHSRRSAAPAGRWPPSSASAMAAGISSAPGTVTTSVRRPAAAIATLAPSSRASEISPWKRASTISRLSLSSNMTPVLR